MEQNATTINTIVTTPQKKERNSSIELLRIILMFIIVLCHSSAGLYPNTTMSGVNKYFLQLTNLSNPMVDIFVLISGYFICKLVFSLKKLLLMLIQVSFYTLVFYLIFVAVGKTPFSVKTFITAFMPTTFRQYWFVSAYVILYLLSPFINFLLNKLSQKQHLALIGTIGLIYSIIPTFTMQHQDGMDVFILLLLYCIGAYLRLYPDSIFMKRKTALIMLLISCLLYFGSVIGLNIIGLKFQVFADHPSYFLTKHCPFTITLAVSIFVIFVKWEFKSKIINLLGSCMFGVYLIHNNGYLRVWLTNDLFKFFNYKTSATFIPYIIGASVLIFIVCTLIELIRRFTLEKLTAKLYDKIFKKRK